ncbi:MAG: SPFH domain-containing protein [Tepidisphaeraceae bacterium]
MGRIKALIISGIGFVILIGALVEVTKWTAMRVFVDTGQALLVINKFGESLPPDMVVVPAGQEQYKGIEAEVRGPGRYFLDPVRYDWKVVDQLEIPAGDPTKWNWDSHGQLTDPTSAPMVGVVTLKQGPAAEDNSEVVPDGCKGIQRSVLTPGTYKINPYLCEVKLEPAIVIPPGSVGVLTRLVGQTPPATENSDASNARLVSDPNFRGISRNVLQPGIYYLNPRMAHVTIVPVGYDQITLQHESNDSIAFTSNDAYSVECDLTVVWGRNPDDAPSIVANIGNIDQVEEYVIRPAMRAACQNEGGKFTAKELIQGNTRSKFQDDLNASLEKEVAGRHLNILLALVRNVVIKDSGGNDQTMGLLATIQQANIEIEKDLTNKQQTQTAIVAAELQQTLRQVDVARENVAAETNVKVAQVLADGQKQAAQITAQQELDVATIERQVAELDAQRTEILGKADADVTQLKAEAQAKGAKMLVDALGSPQAYNLYTFAQGFQPTDLRLIFSGPGTFWTDLKSFPELAGSEALKAGDEKPAASASGTDAGK